MSVSFVRLSKYLNENAASTLDTVLINAKVHQGLLHHSYETEYWSSQGYEIQDESLVIKYAADVVGVCYLLVMCKSTLTSISSNGTCIRVPLLTEGLSPSIVRSVAKQLIKQINDIQLAFSCDEFVFMVGENDSYHNYWSRELVPSTKKIEPTFQVMLDLTRPLTEITSGYRKSYKSLINAGRKQWNVSIMDGYLDADLWSQYELFHLEVAGRKTRSSKSWELQGQMLACGQAFLVTTRNLQSGELIGGAFIQYTNIDALYSVGVYDRKLFDLPLGHVIQDTVIRHLVTKQVPIYNIGSFDNSNVDGKVVNISNFKIGFSDQLSASLLLTV